jgi:hypothetical protein
MNHDEYVILQYLRASPESLFTRKEICRKAVRRTVFEENPRWAETPLAALVGQGLVEVDENGYYRLKRKAME